MPIELWLAYAATSTLLLLLPGPTVLLVIGYAMKDGRGAARWLAPGVALGDFTSMSCSLLGLGAVLATCGELFFILKWLGACYLCYLGVRMFMAPVPSEARDREEMEALPASLPSQRGFRMFAHAYAVTATNPKTIAFFTAFLPQFMTPGAPLAPQILVLMGTFLTLAFANVLAYALLAGSMRSLIARPRTMRFLNRLSGGLLIGAGVMTATIRRSA